MKTQDRVIAALRVIRLVGAVAMLGVVIAGAFGFGDAVKLWSALGGASAAIALKAAHVLS